MAQSVAEGPNSGPTLSPNLCFKAQMCANFELKANLVTVSSTTRPNIRPKRSLKAHPVFRNLAQSVALMPPLFVKAQILYILIEGPNSDNSQP